jgi:hypothetical protein
LSERKPPSGVGSSISDADQQKGADMLDHYSCGMTPAEVAAEAAEAQRETEAFEAQRLAKWKSRVAALPTKHQRYFHRNRVRRTYEAAMARADNLGAVPSWLTDVQKQQILDVYEAAEALHLATGIPHEVDHLVQLVGKNKAGEQVICGLHVPSNLRAIPKSLNRRRGDWFFIADAESDEPTDADILASFDARGGDDEIPF